MKPTRLILTKTDAESARHDAPTRQGLMSGCADSARERTDG